MDKAKSKTRIFNIVAILLIVIFSMAITPKALQNDTFYTIKIGEYIMENGVTMQEPFSWHENLEYTFPHWAYDVLIYSIYNIGGMTGIYISTMILSAILGLTIYFVNTKLVKNKTVSFLITIATMYALKPYICARAQLVTFILFILTIYFIEKFLETKKIRYGIPLIIIPALIANLHLATFYFFFILFMPYVAEYGIYILAYCNVIISQASVNNIKKKIQKDGETPELLKKLEKEEERYKKLKAKQDKKIQEPYKVKIWGNDNTKWLILIMLIALLTGFLTPLGSTPYTYLIKTMQGISTKNINEHLPLVLANTTVVLAVIILICVIIGLTRIKIRLSDLFMVGGLILLTIYSRRQASMLLLIGSVIINRMLSQIILLYGEDTLEKIDKKMSSMLGITIIAIIVISIAMYQYKQIKNDSYYIDGDYPVQAAQWIKENLNLEEIKLYNEYNYGSYLIYEEIPVFIDSRCDLYMPEFNENMYAFRDFLNLNAWSLKNMEAKIDEYGFTHFIVSNSSKMKKYLESNKELYNKIYPTEDIEDKYFTIYESIK